MRPPLTAHAGSSRATPGARRASALGRPALYVAALGASGAAVLAGLGVASPLVPALALAALRGVVGIGVGVPGSGVFARVVVGARTSMPLVALTFDDGPDPTWTPRVLDALERAGHRATFFVVGERAAAHPALVAECARRGHEVANHSWRHSYATPFAAPRALAAELSRASDAIAAATGARPRWFRPPVGLLSPRVVRAAALAGLELVGWTATARDGTAAATVDGALARLGPALAPGAILVLHDAVLRGNRSPIALAVLDALLPRLDAAGLTSVTLSELVDGPRAVD